ncbi:MAG: response regulator transcription factor [Gammaproteobacteria bacterium]
MNSADTLQQPHILIVDDDELFCNVLSDAFRNRNYQVSSANDIKTALILAASEQPEYAVIDLRIGQTSGLTLVQQLHEQDENTRIVVLTGYASIATAVEAIKLGAVQYLTKPADIADIISALHKNEGDSSVEVADSPLSVKRLEWEHLQRVLTKCNGNISEAARQLNMHRRTLQRKLGKRPVNH